MNGRPIWASTRTRVLSTAAGVLLGLVLAAGIFSSNRWIAFFVFALATYVVGYGAGEILSRPHRAERTVYFALLPVICTLTLFACYAFSSGALWPSVVGGLVFGGMIHESLSRRLFPEVTHEDEILAEEPAPRAVPTLTQHGKGAH